LSNGFFALPSAAGDETIVVESVGSGFVPAAIIPCCCCCCYEPAIT